MFKGCVFCRWFYPVGERHLGQDPDRSMWKASRAWESAHSNKNEIFGREADPEALRLASTLYSSDPQAAFQMWLDLAGRGSVWSMFEVAQSYREGCGVARDLGEAEKWCQRAFHGGHQLAMLKCAEIAAEHGNYPTAEAILQTGIEQDWAPAIFWLAWYRHKQSESREAYRNIRPLLEDAAQRGHPGAQLILGRFMAKGKFGLMKIAAGWKSLYLLGRAISTESGS